MLKVLHVAESTRGGCGTYLNELLPLQIEAFGCANVCVIAPDRHLSLFKDIPPSVIRSFARPRRSVGLFFLAMQLLRTLWTFRPDVIHAHSTFAGAIVRAISAIIPRMPPIVYCSHGWVFDTASKPWVKRQLANIERMLSRYSAKIICISNAEKRAGLAAGICAEKLVLITNGIRSEIKILSRVAWKDRRLRLLFVGRLDRQKGLDVLLQAVAPLHEQVCLRIIGEAVLSSQHPPSHFDHVEFLGWQDSDTVASHMASCDIVVIPSRWEGFGLVALEAMRMAKPVIASAVGGLPEIVLDGITGRLIPPEDSTALRNAVLQDDAATQIAMGQAGFARFSAEFTIGKTHSATASLYRAILATDAPS